jgi:hypothetical protein
MKSFEEDDDQEEIEMESIVERSKKDTPVS